MIKGAAYLLALSLAQPAAAQDEAKEERLVLPSGMTAYLQEMLWDRPGDGLVYRFRFVAPDFTGEEDFATVAADLEHLCNSYAMSRLANTGPKPGRIVISMADTTSEFGEFDPDVTQIFESFSVGDDVCIWEMF